VPRVGLEQLQKLREKTVVFRKCDGGYRKVQLKVKRLYRWHSKTKEENQITRSPELEKVIAAWNDLSENIRKAIIALISM
jgi:hypothetical protein